MFSAHESSGKFAGNLTPGDTCCAIFSGFSNFGPNEQADIHWKLPPFCAHIAANSHILVRRSIRLHSSTSRWMGGLSDINSCLKQFNISAKPFPDYLSRILHLEKTHRLWSCM
jgi:hypothetical protein